MRTLSKFARSLLSVLLPTASLAVAANAWGATYQVGPTRSYKTLQDVQSKLGAGDVVEVDGNATYPGGFFLQNNGAAGNPITIRGIRVSGKRPTISGSGSGAVAGIGVALRASHVVFEGFEVTGASSICVLHKGDDITIRDGEVHHCAAHGLLGNDDESGSLLLEYMEFHHSGAADKKHQIYVTSSQTAYPGSVFRMQYCYVHDGVGGNNVKSRTERNEIRYNWIEGAYYHQVELIGPDVGEITPTREDGELVGNVIIGNGSQHWHLIRVGGDTDVTATRGRYRFVNNTFVLDGAAQSIFRIGFEIESMEMHNNIFVQRATGSTPMLGLGQATGSWAVGGSSNWVGSGFTGVPTEWSATTNGTAAGLVDLAGGNFRPAAGSALIDKGIDQPSPFVGHEFPNPTNVPAASPADHILAALGGAPLRPVVGKRDIGAYEFGTPTGTPGGGSSGGGSGGGGADAGTGGGGAGGAGGGSGGGAGGTGGGGAGSGTGGTGNGATGPGGTSGTSGYSGEAPSGDAPPAEDGGGCSAVSGPSSGRAALWSGLVVLGMIGWRRRSRRRTRTITS